MVRPHTDGDSHLPFCNKREATLNVLVWTLIFFKLKIRRILQKAIDHAVCAVCLPTWTRQRWATFVVVPSSFTNWHLFCGQKQIKSARLTIYLFDTREREQERQLHFAHKARSIVLPTLRDQTAPRVTTLRHQNTQHQKTVNSFSFCSRYRDFFIWYQIWCGFFFFYKKWKQRMFMDFLRDDSLCCNHFIWAANKEIMLLFRP